MKKVLPFHQSVLMQLNRSSETLSKNKRIGKFINRFSLEVKTISSTIICTKVPENEIPALISGLEIFYKNFEAKYPRDEDGCGTKKERTTIERSLSAAIGSLKERL